MNAVDEQQHDDRAHWLVREVESRLQVSRRDKGKELYDGDVMLRLVSASELSELAVLWCEGRYCWNGCDALITGSDGCYK